MKNQASQKSKLKPKVLELTPEELERVNKARKNHDKKKVNPEWQFLAEFGYYYGWEGIKAIMDNEMTIDQATQLLLGSRKVWYSKVIDNAIATQTAVASANSKKPGSVMKKGLSNFMKELR